jgi:hypothetical protein
MRSSEASSAIGVPANVAATLEGPKTDRHGRSKLVLNEPYFLRLGMLRLSFSY